MQNKFTISLFNNKFDNKPKVVQRSWETLCEKFRQPKIRAKKDGALFSPAVFTPALRRKENVRSVFLLVLDVDHNSTLSTLKTQVSKLAVGYAVYSTHSHLRKTESNPNAEPRFRVCIPLVSAVSAEMFPVLWQYVKNKTGLPLDESAKDCSRMFYTPVKATKDAKYIFHLENGSFLDWKKLPLDSYTENTQSKEKTTETQNYFEFHEDRHAELCKRIKAKANDTGRGTFEMKCPAHNGKGETSLFYDPMKGTVACLKKSNCSYFEILAAFGLSNKKLKSREQIDKETIEFENTKTKIKPFPVPSEKCFYGIAGDFVRLVEPHTEASPMALLSQFLVYFGNIIGRTAYFTTEGDRQHTNLFCIIVGKTAQGRKGTSFGRVKQVFREIDEDHETECLTSGLASGEGLIYHVRDAQYIQKTNKETGELEEIVADAGVTDKRMLVVEGEFAQVLKVQGRDSNTLSTFIRNLWDSGTARSLTKNSPLRTTDAHVSIIGHITKDELLFTLNEVESANGYANRFLFFAVERGKFLPFGGDVPKVELGQLQERISEAIEYAKQKNRMTFSIKASEIWIKKYQTLETSRFGFLAKVTQRASPQTLRLAVIFALLDKSHFIEKEHLEAALAVWKYSEDSARYIFGNKLGNLTAEKILNALKDNADDGLTRTDIRELFNRHIKNEKLNVALSFLLENSLAKPTEVKTKGRSKEVWFPCVISVKSTESVECDEESETYNAYNAYNAENNIDIDIETNKVEIFMPAGTEV